jgi:capsular polysaccharide transport system permease protein
LVGQLLQSSGLSRSQDEGYAVRDYILSRDALNELEAKIGVREAFSNKSYDVFNRFPGISWDKSFEAFFRYYVKRVELNYDPVTAISVLRVHAFTPQDSYKINGVLLDISERLINTLNDRSRRDLINFADNEVRLASEKAKEASLALLNYRSRHSVFEPDRQAALQLEGVAKIQQDLIATEAELAQLKKLSPSNPQIGALNSRADALRHAIASEASKVTGENGSFSARAPDFERLALESAFADKQLGVALATLETARSEALQKQLYLERLVQPNLPDSTLEPRRLRSTFTIFLVGLISWGVASLLIASIKEHTS